MTVAASPAATFYTDGTVFAVAAAPDRTYIGGSFSLIGAATGSWVAVGSEGELIPGRPPLVGVVNAAVPDGHGGWFVAGRIVGVGSVARSARVIHLTAAGGLDTRWRVPVAGGAVLALARRGNALFLGGGFKRVDGKARPALAAVSVARGGLLPWRPRGVPRVVEKGKVGGVGRVSRIAVSGSTLYVSGGFDALGGRRRGGLAALALGTGRATAWNPAPDDAVSVIQPHGRTIYVGGLFTRIGGAVRHSVAALDAVTGKSRSFNAHAPAGTMMRDLAVGQAAVYLAGDFDSFGGKSRHLLAALDSRTGALLPWEPNVEGGSISALALDPRRNTLYVSGALSKVGGERRDTLAALDTRSAAATPWDPRGLGSIAVLTVTASGNVFAGGDIAFVGGARKPGLASISAAGVTDWNPSLTGTVRTLTLDSGRGRLYVGGAFAPGDVPTQRNLAVVDTATGALHAFGGGANSGVWAVAPSADGSTLFIGGAFVTIAGKRRTRLAALDPATGAVLPWNSGTNDLVRVVLPTADALYVGGDFASAGGLARPRLAKLDLDTGEALSWSPDPNRNVWALALRDQILYAAGEFSQIGGRARNRLAALDVESGQASSWDPNADDTVRSLLISPDGTRLYAGGYFEKMGNAPRGYAEFSLPQGTLTGWDPALAFDGYAISLTPDGSVVVFGGDGGVDVFR